MPTEWQTHLTQYRSSHPHLSLKECMQRASMSYKPIEKSKSSNATQSDNKIDKKSKSVLKDVIALSKDISQVNDLEKMEIKKLKKIVQELQSIHDAHFSDASDSDISDSTDTTV